MPTENDKPTVTAPAAPASEDLKEVKDLKKAQEENKRLKKELADLQAQLASEPEAEAGEEENNYAVINGKRYTVEGTVTARFAGDEGRKGHLHEGLETELAILRK